MGVNSLLKKEGLENIEKLDTLQINKIAANISEKLCKAFPDLNLNQSDLFISLSRLDMYVATMPDSTSTAKYVYGNNSIYFNKNLDLTTIDSFAIHECIHFIQELRDQKGKITRLGLYNPNLETGLALNEAAVQFMASVAVVSPVDTVTYFNMTLDTISPDFYPLECAIINQMVYFTGTYPLYTSTLFSNDIFQNSFISMSDSNTYFKIQKNLDSIMNYEHELEILSLKHQNYDGPISKLKLINKEINNKKKQISDLFLDTQNLIIEKCFTSLFNNISTIDDLKDFQNKLYRFKDALVTTDDYTFYNEFYRKIMKDVAIKRDQYIKFGQIIDTPIKETTSLITIEKAKSKFSKLKSILDSITSFIFGD